MKKRFGLILAAVALAMITVVGTLLIAPGFNRRTDVALMGYSVSEDGSWLTIKTAVTGSMGYTRDAVFRREDNRIYIGFYSAFGGLNGNWGAKNEFIIPIDDNCDKIYFEKSQNTYDLVLERGGLDGDWMKHEGNVRFLHTR